MPRLHLLAFAIFAGSSAGSTLLKAEDAEPACQAIVSVADQKIAVVRDGCIVAKYPVSTSRFGIGDGYGTYRTPLGRLRVCEKLGDQLPKGAVIKHRRATGEVLPANANGRDPIVTRILWLDGMEAQNVHARERSIYIHGTPVEKLIGRPASYGCIRMKSEDIIALYDELGVGATVSIVPEKLPHLAKYVARPEPVMAKAEPPAPKPEAKPEPKLAVTAPKPEIKSEPKPVAQKIEAKLESKAATVAKVESKSETKVETKIAAAPASPAKTTAPEPKTKAVFASTNPPTPATRNSVAASAPRGSKPAAEPSDSASRENRVASRPQTIAQVSPAPHTKAPKLPAIAASPSSRVADAGAFGGETRLASVTVDPNRMAFLKNHQSSLASTSSSSDLILHDTPVSSTDLSQRMKGSILDAGLPGH